MLNEDLNLTHLLFADDILFFVEDNWLHWNRFGLHLFKAASGLNINHSKSSISSINIDSNRAEIVTNR